MVTLMAARPGEPHQVTIRLDPAELGQVQLRIVNPGTDAPPLVEIAVERPETLRLLERDRPQLEQALDRAGIPNEGRVIHLTLAASQDRPDTTAAAPVLPAAPASGDPAQPFASSFPQSTPGGAGQQQAGQQQAGQQHGRQLLPRGAAGFAQPLPSIPDPWSRTVRVGVDITA